MYEFLKTPVHAAFPPNLILLYVNIMKIFGEGYVMKLPIFLFFYILMLLPSS